MGRRAGRGAVSPERWFEVAMELLAEDGYAALKLAPLCRRAGVTTGSFYHHFAGWQAFVAALLEHWEAAQTSRVAALTAAEPSPLDRVRRMKHLAVGLPHRAEAAIRVWSGVDAQVGRAQRRVDARRSAALGEVVAGVVEDRAAAERLARLGMSILVGWQQLAPSAEPDELLALLTEFEAVILRAADR